MSIHKLIFTSIIIFFSFNFSFAQSSTYKPFNLNVTRESILIGVGSVASVSAFVVLENVKPFTAEEVLLLYPADVNSFDRGAIGPYKEDYAGDALLYASYLLPLSFLTYGETRNDLLDLALIYGEVLLIQGSINGIIKGAVQRTRPYVYDDETPMSEKTLTKARLSFFSGHTSITAAITFFTAKVFSEYVEDNTVKMLIWTGAAVYPAVEGLMRVNSHLHFPTDVIVGYAFGALVGYFIPEIHKSKISESVSVLPLFNPYKSLMSIQIKF